MSELVINISKLSLGGHQRSLEASPAAVGLDARFTKPVHVEVEMEKNPRQIYARVEFETGGKFMCDRCLDEIEREVKTGYSVVYVMDGDAPENVKGSEEIQAITPDTNTVDIGEDVRQYALLALPFKILCREDCAGLCPTCGTNWNKAKCDCKDEEIDPRWEGLKQIPKN
ncbi:MAG: DUF177 domain-containing protein [Ignavibacteriae bacterium]|nr:DUF177 domain-containing protein [Ignavibacteriota bacterium]